MSVIYEVDAERIAEKTKIIVAEQLARDFGLPQSEVDLWCAHHAVQYRRSALFETITGWFDKSAKRKQPCGGTFMCLVKMLNVDETDREGAKR